MGQGQFNRTEEPALVAEQYAARPSRKTSTRFHTAHVHMSSDARFSY